MFNKTLNEPDLSTVLDSLKSDIFNTINCVNVGVIQSFDETNQTATVQIAIKRIESEDSDGTRVIKERPLLLKCPVHVLSGGSGYISFSISEGDECIVLFNDREIDNWWNTGDVRPPTTRRTHSPSDALVIVGIRSTARALEAYFTSGIRLAQELSKIELDGTDIESTAGTWTQNGNMSVSGGLETGDASTIGGNLDVDGNLTVTGTFTWGGSGDLIVNANIVQSASYSITAGNGTSGIFTNSVTVVNGIVTAGT